MAVRTQAVTLPVTRILGENPLPHFRDQKDRLILDGGLLPEEKPDFALNTGFRSLPYLMQDDYESTPQNAEVKTIVLENDFLKAAFLPDLGGRLYSLWDKKREREMLFCNPVIKMGNLALRNAWFSGGIEWNFGHFGHTFLTCEPFFFAEGKDENGESFLRMYEFERCKGLFFQIDFHLPAGSPHLIAHMRIINPNSIALPIFLWTNIAVREAEGCRIFSGTEEVIIQVQSNQPGASFFRHGQLPDPFQDGIDHSFPLNIPHAEEYFYQNEPSNAFEAIVFKDGETFYERSTGNYPYRKLFCWGNHAGGKRWQELLSVLGGGAYLEIQSGFARTQQHSSSILPGQTIAITQLFGGADVPYAEFNGDYATAQDRLAQKIDQWLPEKTINAAHEKCLRLAEQKAENLLHCGAGWGALEKRRDEAFVPAHLNFPADTIGSAQQSWLDLLNHKPFNASPSYLISPDWIKVMESALAQDPENSALRTHLGIAFYENEAYAEARDCWQQAASASPNALTHWCLASMAAMESDFESAAEHLHHALELLGKPERAFAEPYLLWLTKAGKLREAYAFYQSLPAAMQQSERIMLNAAASAFAESDDAFMEKLFSRSFATIREGDVELGELWIKYQAQLEALRRGVKMTDEFLIEFRKTAQIPRSLDFRMVND